jgi:hypothetical protein
VSEPVFPDVLQQFIQAALQQVHTTVPAAVSSYDRASQTVTAQPLVLRGYIDPDTLDRALEKLPAVNRAPVLHLGGGPFRLTFPVEPGDTGVLLVSSQAIDRWLAGDGRAPVDPAATRRHRLTDAFFVPGFRPRGRTLAAPPSDGLSLGSDGGPVLEITASDAFLGGRAGAEPGILATTFLSQLGTLVAAIASAVSPIAGGGGTAAAAITSALNTFQTAAATYTASIAKLK